MRFAWGERKRIANLEDHGVDFKDAALIFAGAVAVVEDKRRDYGELHFRALGRVGGDYFIAAYPWRGGVRRIVSAW